MNLTGGDEWDDSELIKAYDRAVKNWRKSKRSSEEGSTAGVADQSNMMMLTSPATAAIGPWISVKGVEMNEDIDKSVLLAVGSWVLGSPCRSVWTQDGLEYEAKIVGIEGPRCTIRFVGYGNQESKELAELKETFGKRSRDRQRREAQAANSQYLTTGGLQPTRNDGEDYFSSVSLTSSMCNNCPSIVNGRVADDEQLTSTTDFSGGQQRESVSSSVFQSPRRINNIIKGSPGKRKREIVDVVDNMSMDADPSSLDIGGRTDNNDTIPLSGAEATMGSSSSSSEILSEDDNEDGDDEATSAPGPFKNGHPSIQIPQFPVPPMPMSLADVNGKFSFSRGQLPSLLLAWYHAGYHAGYFDAQQTKNKAHQQSKDLDPSKSRNSKRQQ